LRAENDSFVAAPAQFRGTASAILRPGERIPSENKPVQAGSRFRRSCTKIVRPDGPRSAGARVAAFFVSRPYSKMKLSTGIFISDLDGLVIAVACASARGSRWSK